MQCLRHIQEYLAPLGIQWETRDAPKDLDSPCCSWDDKIGASISPRSRYFMADYCAMDAAHGRVYSMRFNQDGTVDQSGLFIFHLENEKWTCHPGPPRHFGPHAWDIVNVAMRIQPAWREIWCAHHCGDAPSRLDRYTLDGQWVASHMLKPRDILDVAYHPLLKQILVLCQHHLYVYAWPEMKLVWQKANPQCNFDHVLVHPTTPVWFIEDHALVHKGPIVQPDCTVSKWSRIGQVIQRVNLPVLFSIHLYRSSFLLAVCDYTLLVLSLDLCILQEIVTPHRLNEIHSVPDDDRFYAMSYQATHSNELSLFRITGQLE